MFKHASAIDVNCLSVTVENGENKTAFERKYHFYYQSWVSFQPYLKINFMITQVYITVITPYRTTHNFT